MLKDAKSKGNYVHIAGAGRSKIAGEIFGELLKNLGINVSIIGETLSKPVKKGDILIAVSSSGWTNTTLFAVEQSIKLGAKIIGLTASPGSKLDRLSDITILLPGKPKMDEIPYVVRQLMGRHKTPLTPMGTVSELGTILIGMGLTQAIYRDEGDPLENFFDSLKDIMEEADKNKEMILNQRDNVIKYLHILSENVGKSEKKFYLIGLGICQEIAKMAAMRYQHISLNVQPISNWRFRREGDILVAISGSGENPFVLQYVKEAKRSGLQVVGFTANEGSSLTKLSDINIFFSDISLREDYIKFRIGEERPIFQPIFEIISLLFLESTVAELAEIHQISEDLMRSLHANVE
jgi:D-arabinose 5-phosphate isomerase GutQ